MTHREKELDGAIDKCGLPLEEFSMTPSFIQDVMSRIGAESSEYDFVKSGIAARVRVAAALGRADSLINDTENMLNRFKQDDKEFERIGKSLGFKFWNK